MKKRRITKLGLVLIPLLIIMLIFFVMSIKKIFETEINIIEQASNYNLKVDYPIVNIKTIDDAIEKFVTDEKNDFFDLIKGIKVTADNKFDLNIQYQIHDMDSTTTVYIVSYKYTGGNHYMRNDISFHYNKETKQEINLNYFLVNDTDLTKIANLANYYILKNNPDFLREMVDNGTKPELVNFNNFFFKEEGLEFLFPPYQVAPWSAGDIKITIPYTELKNIVKPEFLKGIEKDEPTSETPFKRNINEFKDKKLIAFTFDDGPSNKVTGYLLDNLDKYQAKVTFFVLGSRVNQNKDVLKRAYLSGNQIGNHTYNHRSLPKLDNNSVINEIKSTNDAINEVIGYTPTLMRPPYGDVNSEVKSISNMYTILWNIDTLDWKYKDKNRVADEIVKNAKGGYIVLLHDIYQTSVEGALMAMERLQKDGYAFVTIDEMMQLKGTKLDYSKSYFSF